MRPSLASPDVAFRPPAPYPGDGRIAEVLRPFQTFRSQVEGLPREVFEADAWRPPLPGMPLFVMSPDAIRTVLLDEAPTYVQGALFDRIMRPVWGDGLLLAQGKDWRFQRKAAAQAFRPGSVDALAPFFTAAAQAALTRWRSAPRAALDLFAEMKRITFDVIIDTMLSGGQGLDRDVLERRVGLFFATVNRIRLSYILAPDRYHAGRPLPVSPERQALRDYLADLVAARRFAPPRGDLVDALMAARDPDTNEALSATQLADNLFGFVLAGHETTAVALAWTLYLVLSHAPTRARLRHEIDDVTGGADVGADVGADHIPKLTFTRQVISEAMRLYPPAYLLSRVTTRPATLSGHALKTGERVNIPIYAIHRRERVWKDPHVFDPDRFAADRPPPDRYAYLPFGGGPRICIGAALAMAESVSILATLLKAADFDLAPDADVWPQAGLALYPKHGIEASVRVF